MSTPEEPRDNTYMISTESGVEMARLIDQDLALTTALGLFPRGLEVREGDQILDVACGPGGWARRVAAEYPSTEIVGVDISQTMINYANAYIHAQQVSNVSFQLMDVTKRWNFADASFDIVNSRLMAGFLGGDRWQHVIAEMLRVLVPGGILILAEIDDFGKTTSSAFEMYEHYMIVAAKRHHGVGYHPFDYHLGLTPKLGQFLQAAGSERVRQEAHVIDFSTGAPAHRPVIEDLKVAFKLLQPSVVRTGVVTQEELDKVYGRMLEEWEAPDFRALWYFLRVWGQKPM